MCVVAVIADSACAARPEDCTGTVDDAGGVDLLVSAIAPAAAAAAAAAATATGAVGGGSGAAAVEPVPRDPPWRPPPLPWARVPSVGKWAL